MPKGVSARIQDHFAHLTDLGPGAALRPQGGAGCHRSRVGLQIHDAAYVEALLLQERRRRELPSSTPLQPKRRELIEDIRLEEPDPARYDRLCGDGDDQEPSDNQEPQT